VTGRAVLRRGSSGVTGMTGLGLFTERGERKSLPFAQRLLWLVISLIVPALAIAAGGLYSAYDAEKSATEEILLQTARTLALHLDRELRKLETSVQVVVQQPLPAAGEQEALRRRVNEQTLLEGVRIALERASGELIFSESETLNALQGSPARQRALHDSLLTGKPVISIHPSPSVDGRVVVIDAPLPGDGPERRIMSVEVNSSVLARFLAGNGFGSSEWNGAAAGPLGDIVARTRNDNLFSEPLAPPALRVRMGQHDEGVINLERAGEATSTAVFSKTPRYGWYFILAYPQHRLEAAFNRSLAWLGALALVAVLGLLHVIYLSRQLLRPVVRLTASAGRLARGDIIPGRRTGVTEFDEVQRALRDASHQLARRNAERDQVEAMLRASEQRLRLAMEASELGAWSFDPETNELTGSDRSRVLMGIPVGRLDLHTLDAALHPKYRKEHFNAIASGIGGREPFIVEICVQWPDSTTHWIEVRGRPVMRASGLPTVVGLVQEITERRTAADRQRMLLRELNHRVKNSLATVQSIALLTRRSTAADQAWEAFEERLVGLAKTHDLLTASDWRGAWLDEALASELKPYQNAAHTRIMTEGPRIRLRPRATLTLCMCFHELATNAAKYGALSTDVGRVQVEWSITPAAGSTPPMLVLTWRESGGPEVTPPTRQGLGSRLLDRGLRRELGGKVEMTYAPTGVACRMELPLDAVTAASLDSAADPV